MKAVRRDMEKLHGARKSVATKTKRVLDDYSNVIKILRTRSYLNGFIICIVITAYTYML
jgi:hypothetical protein